jgi:hypothetical protein
MGVKDDIKKLQGTILGWISTEEGYRGVVAGVVFAVGYFGVIGQLSSRLEEARLKHAEVSKVSEMVDQIHHYEKETLVYQDRLIAADSTAAWGDYVLGMMDVAEVDFRSFSQQKSENFSNFEVLRFEVGVVGEYGKLVDFLDRLERGERYVRIDSFSIGPGQGTLLLTCIVRCLAGMTEEQRLGKLIGEPAGPDPDSQADSEAPEVSSGERSEPTESERLSQGGA